MTSEGGVPPEKDALDKLLGEVRSTINDNKRFLEKLADDDDEAGNIEDDAESAAADEEFEEL